MTYSAEWVRKAVRAYLARRPVAPKPTQTVKHEWTVQEILRNARKPKVHTPSRNERVEKLLSQWLDQLTDPKVDPIEFILRKMAEIVVDTTDG